MPSAPAGVEARYESALAARRARVARFDRLHAAYASARLLVAGVAVAAFVTFGLRNAGLLAATGAAFLVLAVFHARLLARRRQATGAVTYFEAGLRRIRHQWADHSRGGEAYRPGEHPYAADLDLFGRASLFALLATTRTKAGDEVLARWLVTPATGAEARSRQTAVRELAGRADLREHLATLGEDVRLAVDAPILRQWASKPLRLTGPVWRVALAIVALATSSLVVAWLATGRFGTAALVAVLGQSALAWWLQERVRTVIEAVEAPSHDLDILAGLLAVLERETFTSPHLVTLTGRLKQGQAASRQIAALARLVAMLASRRNVMFALPAAFMLWGTQWAFAIEAWRRDAGRHIPEWLDLVGELETLAALGGFADEHPAFVYPEILDGLPRLSAVGLAHPTLGPQAVGNDIQLSTDGVRLIVVSGSNMSGKSTWLRTLGTTVVLAGMGAPVRAEACALSVLTVGAAIRLEDSLTDGRSRFFAEITRLKLIVDFTRSRGGRLLFLLDEILSGTNSEDRRVGADALVRGLLAEGALGLVTTHDLAIGDIVARLPGHAANAHFTDDFADGVLHFDYRLRPGVVTTRNALALMRSIGLEV